MNFEESSCSHPFQSMSLESVNIPRVTTLPELAKERKEDDLLIGELCLGPHAADHIPPEIASRILSLLSANAHNDWLRQKIVVSLHGRDAERAYRELRSKGPRIDQEKRYRKIIEDHATGLLKECLLRVYEDAKKVSRIRNLFAHGIFGRASALEGKFLIFEPEGLTEAHARYTTFDHLAEYPFAQNPREQMQRAFDAQVPRPEAITVWSKESVESALDACECVRRALDLIIETLKPHPLLQADPSEIYKILSAYGAPTTDLRYYFIMREDYLRETGFRDLNGD